MLLYKEHGVNPVGSCLPLVFQLPVFMGLFFVLRGFSTRPAAGRPELPRRLHPEHLGARQPGRLGRLGADRGLRRRASWHRRC